MFYHVRGKLIHVEEGMAAVECAGVAFALKTTNNTFPSCRHCSLR